MCAIVEKMLKEYIIKQQIPKLNSNAIFLKFFRVGQDTKNPVVIYLNFGALLKYRKIQKPKSEICVIDSKTLNKVMQKSLYNELTWKKRLGIQKR